MIKHHILLSTCVLVLLTSRTVTLGDTIHYDDELFFSEPDAVEFWETWPLEYSPVENEQPQPAIPLTEEKPASGGTLENEYSSRPSKDTLTSRPQQKSTPRVVLLDQAPASEPSGVAATDTHKDITNRLADVEYSVEQLRITYLAIGIAILGIASSGLCYWLYSLKYRGHSDVKTTKCDGNTELSGPAASRLRKRETNSTSGATNQLECVNGKVPTGEATSSDARFAAELGPATSLDIPCRADTQQDCNETLDIPEPIEAVERLLASMQDVQSPRKLRPANDAWSAGFARDIGPVRPSQQDYVFSFYVDDILCSLLADGAGGHPHGEWASYLGTMGAASSLAHLLAFWPEDRELQLEKIARQAVEDASLAIATHAVAHGIPQQNSLRSTLIVVLADRDEFAWANLGDGGGWVVQATPQRLDSFLIPAKGAQQNHLLSSLGPDIRGKITGGTRSWEDADFLCIASDGVADVINRDVFVNVNLSACLENEGDFSKAAEDVLDLFVSSPHVTDNVSLSFVGRGRPPVLVDR